MKIHSQKPAPKRAEKQASPSAPKTPIQERKSISLKTPNDLLFYGYHAVRALFENRREHIIRAFCVEERMHEVRDLLKWCATQKKAYHVVTKEDLEKITTSVHHEGVAVLAKKKEELPEQVLYAQLKKEHRPLVILDEVLNPHNVGAIMRVMGHFGWTHLLCHESHAVTIASSAARMSEGGSEYVEVTHFKDTGRMLQTLKALGYETFGTSTHGRKSLYTTDMRKKPCAFFFGNEVKGLDKALMQELDTILAIPSKGSVQSLNVSVASALVIGEWERQSGLRT